VTVRLNAEHSAQLLSEAKAEFPRECCGLIEGTRDGDDFRISGLHPARNLASDPNAFEIDPAEQFRLMRALRGSGRGIIGCYHSHPNGKPEPSQRDVASAVEEGFLWLIMSVGDDEPGMAAYMFDGRTLAPMSISPLE